MTRGRNMGGVRKWSDDAWRRDLEVCHRCKAEFRTPCRTPNGTSRSPHSLRAVRRGHDDPWFHGYATALAQIWLLHHDGQMVRHIMTACGVRFKALEEAGCNETDLKAIRYALQPALATP